MINISYKLVTALYIIVVTSTSDEFHSTMSRESLLPFISVVRSVEALVDFKATNITVHDEVSQVFLFHI